MRIRTIKPEFWKNEHLARLSEKTRLIALALLNYADDEGYFYANADVMRGELFPFDKDSRSLQVGLTELSKLDYLRLGQSGDGRMYGRIVNFNVHQKVNNPSSSKIKGLVPLNEPYGNPTINLHESYLPEQGNGTGNRETEHTSAKPASPARARDALFDALAAVSGANPAELTINAARACGVALAQIRKATKEVTPAEIERRALNYQTHFQQAALTPSALANHWATCANASTRFTLDPNSPAGKAANRAQYLAESKAQGFDNPI